MCVDVINATYNFYYNEFLEMFLILYFQISGNWDLLTILDNTLNLCTN